MSLYDSARQAHLLVGTVVLASFWWAALAAKGSPTHRRGGRLYLVSMTLLLAATLGIAAGHVADGAPMRAVFNIYVSLISVVTVWMAWRSIADRDAPQRYLGWPFRLLCAALGGYGLFLLVMVPRMGSPARMAMVTAFAALGLSIAGAMAWRLRRGADSPRWWLAEHLTAMAMNFGATHASFSLLAGATVFPLLKDPWVRTAVLSGWMLAAWGLRAWAGRQWITGGRAPAGARQSAMAPVSTPPGPVSAGRPRVS